MKLFLKIIFPLSILFAVGIFFWEDFQVWYYVRQYKNNLESFKKNGMYELERRSGKKGAQAILEAFYSNPPEQKEALRNNVDVIHFFHEKAYPPNVTSLNISEENLHKKSFQAMLLIYEKSLGDTSLCLDIAEVFKDWGLDSYYAYYAYSQDKDLVFYGNSYNKTPSLYPVLNSHSEEKQKEERPYWCESAYPYVKKYLKQKINQRQSPKDSILHFNEFWKILEMTEYANCNSNPLEWRKLLFEIWVNYCADKERQIGGIQSELQFDHFVQEQRQERRKEKLFIHCMDVNQFLFFFHHSVSTSLETEILDYLLDSPPKSLFVSYEILGAYGMKWRLGELSTKHYKKLQEWVSVVNQKFPKVDLQRRLDLLLQ